jgi:hypothetical protein
MFSAAAAPPAVAPPAVTDRMLGSSGTSADRSIGDGFVGSADHPPAGATGDQHRHRQRVDQQVSRRPGTTATGCRDRG